MAQLIVRDLPDHLVQRLKARAAKHGRSAEAEHREILRSVLANNDFGSFKEALAAMPDVGDGAAFAAPRSRGRKVKL